MTIRTEAFSTCENAASAEEMLEIKIYIYRRIMTDIQFLSLETSIQSIYTY